MISSTLGINIRSLLSVRGHIVLSCANYRRTAQIVGSSAKKVISSTSNQSYAIFRRQIKIQSDKGKHTHLSNNPWDKVPKDFTLVYESNLKIWIWGFYTTQITLGPICCYSIYDMFHKLQGLSQDTLAGIAFCYGLSFSIICFLNFLMRRILIRIYYNSQSGQFLGVRRSCIGRLKKITYTPEDVVLVNKPKVNVDVNILVKIKNKKYQITSSGFVSPMYYNMHVIGQGLMDVTKTFVQGPKF